MPYWNKSDIKDREYFERKKTMREKAIKLLVELIGATLRHGNEGTGIDDYTVTYCIGATKHVWTLGELLDKYNDDNTPFLLLTPDMERLVDALQDFIGV